MKKIVIAGLTCCMLVQTDMISVANAQDFDTNHDKYWFYRWRLRNTFMKVGLGQGESIPASIRGRFSLPTYMSTSIDWGDSGTELGWYMLVLATEHKILTNNGRVTEAQKTANELYAAMKALERLDKCSDNGARATRIANNFVNPCTVNGGPATDGYFLRDDVPPNFVSQNLSSFNDTMITSHFVDREGSDWINITLNIDNSYRNLEMSQDQAYHMLFGLAMVKKLMPFGPIPVSDPSGVVPGVVFYNFQNEAKDFSEKIIKHIRSLSLLVNDEWIIKDPVTGNPVNRGPDARFFSKGVANVYEQIVGSNLFAPLANTAFASGWHGLQSNPLGLQIINDPLGVVANLGGIINNQFFLHRDNRAMTLILAAIGDSWRLGQFPPFSFENTTNEGIVRVASHEGWDQLYLLYWKVFHDKTDDISDQLEAALADIDNAPCEGPFWLRDDIGSHHTGWGSFQKYRHDLQHQFEGDEDDRSGQYNGIDYMVIHNLYYLANGDGNLSLYFDKINTHVETPYPSTVNYSGLFNLTYGNTQSPAYISSFSRIFNTSEVDPGGKVIERAGVAIKLEPGFHAHSGSHFHARVKPFQCTNDAQNPEVSDYGMPRLGVPQPFIGESEKTSHDQENPEAEESLIEDVEANPSLVLSPNPSNGIFRLSVPSEADGGNVIVVATNLQGQRVFRRRYTVQELSEGIELDLKQPSAGTYLLSVQMENRTIREKFVVR